jgi:CBS domain-containing protein
VADVAATGVDIPIRSIEWEELITVDAALSVRTAAALMTVNGVGALVVTEPGVAPAIITERDITRAAGTAVDLDRSPCGAAAERSLVVADADETVGAIARRMLSEGIRHVPVVRDGEIVTVLSIRDLLAADLLAPARDLQREERP